jgi:hypothetical protein
MYYPKSQIKTNLYTNGGQLVYLSNNQLYTGYYWTTSDGKYFTGKTPQDGPIEELTSLTSTTVSQPSIIEINRVKNDTTVFKYNQLKSTVLTNYNLPTSYQPQPTQQDYQLGEFRRYFAKKTNEIIYIEVDKDTYENILNKNPQWSYQYYIVFNMPWVISGDKLTVAKTNKNIVDLTIQRFDLPKFNMYLKNDYTKFYK